MRDQTTINKQTNKHPIDTESLVFYDPTHTPTFLHKRLKLFDRNTKTHKFLMSGVID